MLRIRFLRVGKKNSPSFRVVVTPRRTAAKTGRFLEILGFYNPLRHEKNLKKERVQYWLSQGAQPSDSVRNMLISEGIMEGEKIAAHSLPKKKEDEAKSMKSEGEKTSKEAKKEVKEEMLGPETPAESEKKGKETETLTKE